jgi:hypothetical protein
LYGGISRSKIYSQSVRMELFKREIALRSKVP